MADDEHEQMSDRFEPARCPGPATRDIILKDPGPPAPAVITEECYDFLGDEDLSYDVYTDPAIHQQEMERLWPEVWQFACREEHLPKPGDSYVYDIGDISILLVRQRDLGIKAFINSCKHRGMQLRPCGARGQLKAVRCPFHGFVWGIDGKFVQAPCQWDFPHIKADEFALDEVHVGLWEGFVFINMSDNPPPLETYLEVLPEHFSGWPMSKRHVALHIEKKLPANWKLAQEAFLEAYHVIATHPQGLPTAGDANAQYDVFGENTSRFVHTIGFPSPHLPGERSQDLILADLGGEALGLKLEPGQTAREVFAEHLRKTIGEAMRVDLTNVSISEMIDSIEYHCFPNFIVFPGVSLPMVYRFRPDGDDVDSSIFDLFFMALTPDGETSPPAPDPILIDAETSFTTVPGMSPELGEIYDQDTDNLIMQTRGLKTSRKKGQTLGNYQEVRIRRVRKTLDAYLSACK
ncbi:MAG: aromatic ring-hydroxylating dioxygenase subunit alpha [Pseudomonadota bacterium]